jgi:hypothetical protein
MSAGTRGQANLIYRLLGFKFELRRELRKRLKFFCTFVVLLSIGKVMLNKHKYSIIKVLAVLAILLAIGTPQFIPEILSRNSRSFQTSLTGALSIGTTLVAPERKDDSVKAKSVLLKFDLCSLVDQTKCANVTKAILVDRNYVSISDRHNFLLKNYKSLSYAMHQVHDHKFFAGKFSPSLSKDWQILKSFGYGTEKFISPTAAEKAFTQIKKASPLFILNKNGDLFEAPSKLSYVNLITSLSSMKNGGSSRAALPIILSHPNFKDAFLKVETNIRTLQNYAPITSKPYPISVSIVGSGANRQLQLTLQIDDAKYAALEESGIILQIKNKVAATGKSITEQPFSSHYLPLNNFKAYPPSLRPTPTPTPNPTIIPDPTVKPKNPGPGTGNPGTCPPVSSDDNEDGSASTTESECVEKAECGNNILEEGEECDGDVSNGKCTDCVIECDPQYISTGFSCEYNSCGDGARERDEECEPGQPITNGWCNDSCTVQCYPGYSSRKTIWPFDGDKVICSQFAQSPCGETRDRCSGAQFDYDYRPDPLDPNHSWKCGTEICYERGIYTDDTSG